jgi:hypothetical protein
MGAGKRKGSSFLRFAPRDITAAAVNREARRKEKISRKEEGELRFQICCT